jgi:hypothetical protein
MRWDLFGYAALGVLALASKWGHDGLRVYVPTALIKTLHLDEDRNTQMEFLCFVILGSIFGILMGGPETPRQAVAAGLGWTGLLSIPSSSKARTREK